MGFLTRLVEWLSGPPRPCMTCGQLARDELVREGRKRSHYCRFSERIRQSIMRGSGCHIEMMACMRQRKCNGTGEGLREALSPCFFGLHAMILLGAGLFESG